jgi:hypothetical protein
MGPPKRCQRLRGGHFGDPIPDIVIRAIAEAFSSEHGELFVDVPAQELPQNLLKLAWDERECVRLVKLALYYPSLLSTAEKKIWERIRGDDRYWADGAQDGGKTKSATDTREERNLRIELLEADWEELNQRQP